MTKRKTEEIDDTQGSGAFHPEPPTRNTCVFCHDTAYSPKRRLPAWGST